MSNNFNELSAAEAFTLVAQTGSFAKVAKLRGENPSSISRAVAQLEKHLQVQLLARSTRSVKLTEAGEIYLQYARAMLQSRADARETLSLLNSGRPHGTVRISLPVVLGENLLAGFMQVFQAKYPEIHLQVDLSNQPVKLIEEGIDLAVRVGHLEDSNLRLRKLGAVYRQVYVSKTYADKFGVPEHPADLVNHQTIAFSARGVFSDWHFWQAKTGQRHPHVDVKSWFTCNSPTVVLSMIRNGLGVGRSSKWMVDMAPFRQELIHVLPNWLCEDPANGGVPMYLVFPPGPAGQLPLKTRVVADFIEQLIPPSIKNVR